MSKQIIVSIHDISPKYRNEVIQILKTLKKINLKKKDLLIVLDFENKNSFIKDKKLVSLIKKEFKNKSLPSFHGIIHYKPEKQMIPSLLFGKEHSNVSEFKDLEVKEINKTFKQGVTSYRKIFNTQPKSFVPARWDISEGVAAACKKNKISYYETFKKMINLKENKTQISPICSFDMGSNILLTKFTKIYAYYSIFISRILNRPLRYCLHPNDVKTGNFNFEIKLLQKLIKNGWKPMTTQEFWDNNLKTSNT